MKKLLILPLVLLTLSPVSIANEAPIDEMFRVMSMDKQLTGGFEAMLPVIEQLTLQHKLDENAKEELKGIFRSWFEEDLERDKMLNDIKALYLQVFSEDEIKEITKFYQSRVGKKFLDNSNFLMQKGAQIGMQEAQSKQVKLMERVKPFLDKHQSN
jgi:hypothetical protein